MGIVDRYPDALESKKRGADIVFGTLLLLTLSLIFVLGAGRFLEHAIVHDYPITFVDYDHFAHLAMARLTLARAILKNDSKKFT